MLGETLESARRLTGLDPSKGEWLVFQTIVQCALLMGPGPPPGMSRAQLVGEFRGGNDGFGRAGQSEAIAVRRPPAARILKVSKHPLLSSTEAGVTAVTRARGS